MNSIKPTKSDKPKAWLVKTPFSSFIHVSLPEETENVNPNTTVYSLLCPRPLYLRGRKKKEKAELCDGGCLFSLSESEDRL